MKKLFSLSLVVLAATLLLSACRSVSHSAYLTKSKPVPDGLETLAAPGQKVYIDWFDAQGDLSKDELEDFQRLTKDYTLWNVVDTRKEADFVLRLIENKKWVLGSPSCWITPEILTPGGQLLWRGNMTRGEANEFNGFRATDRCFKKMLKYEMGAVPALEPAIKMNEL